MENLQANVCVIKNIFETRAFKHLHLSNDMLYYRECSCAF